jgi:hypothetical protein
MFLSFLQLLVISGTAVYVAQQVRYMRISQQATVEMEKRRKSLEFISRFNDSHIVSLRSAVRAAAAQGKLDEARHSVLAYLNFFEEMALAIRNGLAHEEICRRFFNRILLHTCAQLEAALQHNPGAYVHLKDLRQRWEQPMEPIEGVLAE